MKKMMKSTAFTPENVGLTQKFVDTAIDGFAENLPRKGQNQSVNSRFYPKR